MEVCAKQRKEHMARQGSRKTMAQPGLLGSSERLEEKVKGREKDKGS